MARDPVCGSYVSSSTPFKGEVDGETMYFCSEECMEEFEYHADEYLEQSEEKARLED